jgi:hypothetical protein
MIIKNILTESRLQRGDNMAKKKKNVFKDGVKNAEDNENIGERLNMPVGSKRPKNTSK